MPLPQLSPVCPRGFEEWPEPPVQQQPLLAYVDSTPVDSRVLEAIRDSLEPLFQLQLVPLISSPPMSSPHLRPTDRRNTLAGMEISNRGGVYRSGASVKASMLKDEDGEDVTARALETIVDMLKVELSPDVGAAMCSLFNIDDDLENEVEESLLAYGGIGALDQAEDHDGAATATTIAT
ncbi:hypothetical protein ZWY2020_021583 [Hordeum vulgare]|nr:hypothetical protein ZWY2020_021583 [Hordeum vulgare]